MPMVGEAAGLWHPRNCPYTNTGWRNLGVLTETRLASHVTRGLLIALLHGSRMQASSTGTSN